MSFEAILMGDVTGVDCRSEFDSWLAGQSLDRTYGDEDAPPEPRADAFPLGFLAFEEGPYYLNCCRLAPGIRY